MWFEIKNINEIDSPALLVFTDRVRHNIQLAIDMVGDVNRLRPHIKTHKCPDVTRLMIEAGITKFKCATIAEAEILGIEKAKDVVLAYQPLGPKLKRFIEVIKKYPATKFSCLTDNIDAAKEQNEAFIAAGVVVPVYIDLNVGMNRTGIAPGEEAEVLYAFFASAQGLQAAGLHAYDGHLRNPDLAERKKECDKGYALVEKMKASLESKGLEVPNIIAGGSPAFPIHAERKQIECSPGTFVYWDKGYSDNCPEQKFLPAAVLLTRVISLPSATKVCTDLGHKSVAAENEITRRVHFLNVEELTPVGQSEEHFLLEAKEGHAHKPGEIFYALPFHVCPTVALYEKVLTVSDGICEGEWRNAARDRTITI